MFLSYLKIAWKVLLRRKFFTFISLFGISFTLMMLVVLYALFDNAVGPARPELRTDRLLFINRMILRGPQSQSASSVGYDFLNRYVRTLRTPEKVAVSERGSINITLYVGKQVVKVDRCYTDGNYWSVLDFDFVAGRPYNGAEVRDAAHVLVLNETVARRSFGSAAAAVGRAVQLEGQPYQVLGVVRDVPTSRELTYAECWLPVTTTTADLRDPSYMGDYQAIVLARQAADVPAIQAEYQQVLARLPIPEPEQYREIKSYARTLLAHYMANHNNAAGQDGDAASFWRQWVGLGLLFMLLPALNLVNINVSRTLERAAEIGVRKAFGATAGTLIRQFLVENLFLTLLGGLLGLALAALVLYSLNESHFIPYAHLGLNGRVFGVGLLLALLFGVLSGVYPAYKMSKLPANQALKGGIAL
ncbi:ABC transporter permease [Hymenobacter psychrophilus]|uniref:Putative ABC transport system permease protein n=1 Tax=Hymenobacter psychrophilus TaxID=651662 RepID=A0A1H3NJ44_9BACT|nr:ABC transporter permease [Hymenobacter psychrophilus]SDY88710.1 putative ABC transport system permease protein [Hymenobacter psychrophilus]